MWGTVKITNNYVAYAKNAKSPQNQHIYKLQKQSLRKFGAVPETGANVSAQTSYKLAEAIYDQPQVTWSLFFSLSLFLDRRYIEMKKSSCLI